MSLREEIRKQADKHARKTKTFLAIQNDYRDGLITKGSAKELMEKLGVSNDHSETVLIL
jgi:hypothetical protein